MGLTQVDLAKLLEVNEMSVVGWRKGDICLVGNTRKDWCGSQESRGPLLAAVWFGSVPVPGKICHLRS